MLAREGMLTSNESVRQQMQQFSNISSNANNKSKQHKIMSANSMIINAGEVEHPHTQR